jgi:uncharacterized protein with beta-barrel porin domain
MTNRFIDKLDFSSRFRILKGGKISLVVSALVASTVLAPSANAISAYNSFVTDADVYVHGTSPSLPGMPSYEASDISILSYPTTTATEIYDGKPAYLVYTADTIDAYTSVILTNSGTLSHSGALAQSEGMVIDATDYTGLGQDIAVTNNTAGDINATATSKANGIAIYRPSGNYSVDSIINNSGKITAEATQNSATANGIFVSDTTSTTSTLAITNTGVINVVSSAGTSLAKGIYVKSTNSGDTITNGTDAIINAYGTGGVIGISTTGDGNIINNGKIYISSNGSGYKKAISSVSGSITNNGTIEATINTATSINDMFDSTTNTIQNGSLDKSTYAIETFGNVTNNANGDINGNLYIGGSGSLTNAGTVSLPYNANGAYKAIIGGNFTNSGTLEIGVNNVNGTLSYSQLNVGSSPFHTITFTNGSKINVNVLDQTNTNSLLIAGTTVLEGVITTSTGMFIDYGLVVTDNSALVDFEKEYDNTIALNGSPAMLNLKVVKASSNNIVDTTIAGGGQTPAREAAKTLQFIQDRGTYTAMTTVFSQLNTLTSNEAVAKAVESFTPQISTATQTASSQISAGVSGIVTQRQNISLGGGLNSGDMTFNNKNLWVKPYGSIGSQDDKDGMNGFDVQSYGIGIGVDGEYNDNYTLGFGVFYTNANVDMNNMNQETNLDVFSTLVYGSAPVVDNKTHFMYQVGYAWQKTDSSRDIALTSQTAKSDFTSNTASVDLKLARDYRINDSLLLQPIVSATYTKYTTPSYSESGAGALNLQVDTSSSESMVLDVGTNAYYKTATGDRLVGNINLGYDVRDDKNIVTSSYEGAVGVTFDTEGIDNGRWNYDVGFGYETDLNKLSNINVSYNIQGEGSDYMNHVVSAKYVYKF